MAELKRNFLKAKMNKDLDERLIPEGEYRDALNIQITTSEESNTGSAQILKSNRKWDENYVDKGSTVVGSGSNFGVTAKTVGTYVDEENNYIYNFVCGAGNMGDEVIGGSQSVGIKSDLIEQIKPHSTNPSLTETKIVFHDVYEIRYKNTTPSTNNYSFVVDNIRSKTLSDGYSIPFVLGGVRVGMKVEAVHPQNGNLYGVNNDVYVKNIREIQNPNGSEYIVDITAVEGRNSALTQAEINEGVVLKFTSPRILNFSKGSSIEEEQNTDGSVSNTPSNSMITALNVIDDFLLWTDGRNEPKKINIKRSIKGTVQNQSLIENIPHTILVVSYKNIDQKCGYIKESHITVLKPNPLKAPKAVGKVNNASYIDLSVPIIGTYTSQANYGSFSLHYNNSYINENTNLYIKFNVDLPNNPIVGDILKLYGTTNNYIAYFNVVATPESMAADGIEGSYYTLKLRGGLPDEYNEGGVPSEEPWVASFDVAGDLYKDDFLRFAYRYKYVDGEYSCISPFSAPAFVPGNYSYDAKNGFNLGMLNYMQSIELSDYIEPSIPEDVVEVELIFKSQKTINFYAFKSIYRDVLTSRTVDKNIHDYYYYFTGNPITISDTLSGYTIPTDQILRTFDAVPVKAIAQEIQSNRLMYGNYTQDYDLIDATGEFVNPNINSLYAARNINFGHSWNSQNVLSAAGLPTENQEYSVTSFGNSFYYAGVLASAELSDDGNNYANNVYTAPISGVYKVKASIKLSGGQTVQFAGDPSTTDLSQVNSKLVIARVSDTGAPILTTAADNSTFIFSQNSFAPQTPFITTPVNGTGLFEIVETEVNLEAGDKIRPFVFGKAHVTYVGGMFFYAENAAFEVVEAPSTTDSLPTLLGKSSVKSNRSYDVGVVYRDFLGRESKVIVSEDQQLTVPKSSSRFSNQIVMEVNHKAPYWADTYKFFIKENSSKFNNLVMEAAFLASDFDYAYLVFNQVDKNKVTTGDFLELKKKHLLNTPSILESSSWRVVGVIGENSDGSVEGTVIPDSAAASVQEGEGKFFVKVKYNTEFAENIGNLSTEADNAISSQGSSSGAVFEVVKRNQEDLDIYSEIADSYALRLDVRNAKNHIKINSKVSIDFSDIVSCGNLASENTNVNPKIIGIKGAVSKGLSQQAFNNEDAYCIIELDPLNPASTGFAANNLRVRITDYDGSYVTARLAKDITQGDTKLWLHPEVHPILDNDNGSNLRVGLPWFNCYSFGNGVESDTIQDQFTAAGGVDQESGATLEQIAATEIWTYTASGKQSGFKSNIASLDYNRSVRLSDIIYSEIYDGKNSNRLNEFIPSNSIIKRLNPDYGSIQKLFSRDTDVLVLCESKCLKVLSEKDALFNADGSSQLLARNKVLGTAVPFSGDYGISKNPESFAADEFRVYFTDRARGAVLRLSKDGLTAISNFGMKNWFADKLLNSTALVGSFDSKKEEYNLTLHDISNLNVGKYVYTVSFNENAKGWASFKSFIPEHGLTLNNQYFTFKNGYIYKHHDDSGSAKFNNFYGKQYNSTIDLIFNSGSSLVKDFKTINYEGTKAKDLNNNGWYTEYVNTDLQQGEPIGFVNKEGRWFSAIKGQATKHINIADGGTADDTNIDFAEVSVQGLSNMLSDATLYSGTLPSQGFNLIINASPQGLQDA